MHKTGKYWLGKNVAEEKLFYHKLHMNQQHVTVAKKGNSRFGVN